MEEEVKKLAERIAEEEDVEVDEVLERIERKEDEYSGLISKEGAAHIVAKEAGIELVEDEEGGALDIKNVVSGMNSATITGKVERAFEPREFETDDGKGKVANLILRDETGTIRFSLWNEEVEKFIEEEKVGVGDTIRVKNGYVTEDNRGQPEIRLGRSGKIEEVDVEIDVEVDPDAYSEDRGRTKIEDIMPGQSGEIRGTVVNVFTKSPFFKKCPECEKRVDGDECEEHEDVEINMALSAVVDDGTGSMRSVFFRENAEDLTGVDTDDAWEMTEEGEAMESFTEKCNELLGKEIVVSGRVKMNDFFGSPELIVDSFKEADPKEEAEAVLKSL